MQPFGCCRLIPHMVFGRVQVKSTWLKFGVTPIWRATDKEILGTRKCILLFTGVRTQELTNTQRRLGQSLWILNYYPRLSKIINMFFFIPLRSLSSGSFSSDFHIFSVEWFPTGITFKVDGQVIGSVSPPTGGFWQLSGLTGSNPWASGTKMAPFDKNVSWIFHCSFIWS